MPETIIELGVSAVSTVLPGRWLLERQRFNHRDGRYAPRHRADEGVTNARNAMQIGAPLSLSHSPSPLCANQSIGRLPTPVQRDAITNIAILLWHYGSPSSSYYRAGLSPSRRSIRDNSVTSHRDARDNARSAARGPSLPIYFRPFNLTPSIFLFFLSFFFIFCMHTKVSFKKGGFFF